MNLARRFTAEALGTAPLLAVVVGFANHGRAVGGWDDAIALLGTSLMTGCGLRIGISTGFRV
jgi:hypothetical protein